MAASKLPTEILVEEILPRLPVKSLLRFKCVSKFFQTLISTPEFVNTHLLHSLSSDDSRLLILMGRNSGVYSCHLGSPEFTAGELCFPGDIDKSSGASGLFAVGSCNGLVCIGTSFSSLIIFNPSTRIYRQIYRKKISGSNAVFGFGFDDISDDYKIVRVSLSYYDYDELRRDVEVYSLKSDSWSFVESTSSPDLIRPMVASALIDNHLVHWEWWNPSNRKHGIDCFDLRNNQWGEDVPVPDHYPDIGVTDFVYLKVLDGCLCLWATHIEGIVVDFWVMKEYGVKGSWVKLGSISNWVVVNPKLMICALAYAKGSRSEILVTVDSLSRMFWYNIRNKTWRVAEIHGVPVSDDACLCNGSLVSIPGGVRYQTLIEESRT